jgi:hypothetical protein
MKNLIISIAFFTLFLISDILALPRFALIQGVRCASCHVNPTGGAMRNDTMGKSFGREYLPLKATHDNSDFDPKISESISIGSDMRTQFLWDEFSHKQSFQAMQFALYVAVNLNEKIRFFGKYDVFNYDWEAYGIARIFPNLSYVKIGAFLPAYGLRVDDHTVYTRGGNIGYVAGLGKFPNGMIFLPNYREIGIEFGINILTSISIHLAIANGNKIGLGVGNYAIPTNPPIDFSQKKSLIARVEYLSSISDINYFVGGSYYNYDAMRMFNGFAGLNFGRFTAYGEYNTVKNLRPIGIAFGAPSLSGTSTVYFGELDVLIIDGLFLTTRYEFFDPTKAKKDELSRIVLGFEFFPYSYMELRPQYRIHMEDTKLKNNLFILQTHFWF